MFGPPPDSECCFYGGKPEFCFKGLHMLHFLIQMSFGLDVLGSYFSPPFDSFGRQWIVVRVHFLARAQYLWPCWFWLTYHDYFHLTSLKVVKASFFPQLQHLVQNAISGPQSELKPHIYQLCFSSPPPHSYAVNRSLLLGIRRSHRQGVAIRSEYITIKISLFSGGRGWDATRHL